VLGSEVANYEALTDRDIEHDTNRDIGSANEYDTNT